MNLSDTDLVINNGVEYDSSKGVYADTRSSIRLNSNGGAEILLMAKGTGKFAVSGKTVYALSTEDNGKDTGNTSNTPANNG